ncbi:MAG: hypothetical protein QM758_22910 [Armatimonas sp.]
MKLQNAQKRGRLRHILLALAAFLFCFHFVVEPLHAASHTGASKDCALCQIFQTQATPPEVPVALPLAPTTAFYSPVTPWIAIPAPTVAPAPSQSRGPPSLS